MLSSYLAKTLWITSRDSPDLKGHLAQFADSELPASRNDPTP